MKKLLYTWLLCLFTSLYFTSYAQHQCTGNCINLTNGGSVNAGTTVGYNGNSGITAEAWIYPTSLPTAGNIATIMGKSDGGSSPTAAGTTFTLYLTNNQCIFVFSNGTTLYTVTCNGSPTLNSWNHIAGRWQSGQAPDIYMNGAVAAFGSSAVTATLGSNSNSFRIGTSGAPNETGFKGYIDEVRTYKYYLTDGQVNSYAQNSANFDAYYTYMVHYYQFQEGVGTTTVNFAPNSGALASLVGNASWTNSLQPCNAPDINNIYDLAQSGNYYDRIKINWTYPYTYPIQAPLEAQGGLFFKVYRDGISIGTVAYNQGTNLANARSFAFVDSNITACTHSYYVLPQWGFLNGTTTNGSNSNTIVGRTTDIHFAATKGASPLKTTLSWDNIASTAPGGFEILRNGQQIAVLTAPSSQSYNDFDGVPGLPYQYEIRPLPASAATHICTDSGWVQANGRLSGYVKSPLQAAVPDVIVTATATINNVNYTYRDTTDASGFFEIRNVFYNTQADYTLTPSKGTHHFNPANIQRTLDQLAYNAPQANFIDTSVFTVSGTVTFPNQLNQPGCAAAGVTILVNGIDRGIRTSTTGTWSYTATDEGNYTFTPVFKSHTFGPPSRSYYITDNTGNVDFSNTTTDVLHLSVMGYCNTQVCDNSVVHVTGTGIGGCYDQSFTVQGNSERVITLPAQQYLVTISSVADANDANNAFNVQHYSLPSSFTVDLSQRDTINNDVVTAIPHITGGDTIHLPNGIDSISVADTTYTYDTTRTTLIPEREAHFRYGGTFALLVSGFDTMPGCNKVLVSQGNTYQTRVDVFRTYNYANNLNYCRLDSGVLTIYDDVSDSGFVTYNIDSGYVRYDVNPGRPNISPSGQHGYEKYILFNVSGPGATSISQTCWMTVLGNRQLSPTFITKTPELPFFVLHDPPGDGSSATLSQGSTLSYGYSTGVETAWGAGIFTKIKIGAETPVPFTGIVFDDGDEFSASIKSNNKKTYNDQVNTSFTMTNSYSTSGDPSFVGEDADVIVGASLNMIYGLSYILNYDTAQCTADVDTALTWGANDFATTYTYTIGHIKHTLIPQFQFLHDYYANLGSDSALIYQNYLNVWNQVVDQNHRNITGGEFKENRSFSAGISYSNSTNYENSEEFSINYQTSIASTIAGALDIGTENNSIQVGTEVNLSWTVNKSKDSEVDNTKSVSYTLQDDDAGDFFSVDIKRDKKYGTPAFTTVAGTSSCPHEQGTQQRDMPTIEVLNPIQQNVPVTSQAVFTVQMSNFSESQEARTYEVIVDPNSNLDGAVVRLAGQLISQFPASFTIPANQSIFGTLSVEKGPVAVDYNNLKLIIYSPCDSHISDHAEFTVGFQSNCVPVMLYTPSDNWLVNTANPNLNVTYGGFNANDSSLTEIGLEIHVGNTWNVIPASRVTLQQLQHNNAPYYAVNLNMGGFADGNYDIRAYSICNTVPPVRSYSPMLSGVIDHSSITLFGTPSPSDGVLNYGEDISVAFNESLDCNHLFNLQNLIYDSVTLTRNDNGQLIPSQYACNGSSIIITSNPPSLIDSLENVAVTARVKNIYSSTGNILNTPVEWSFVVNRSKQYWSPSSLSVSLQQNSSQNVNADLKNDGISAASYTLIKVPSWMSIGTTTGNIAAGNVANLTFGVSAALNPGNYNDTVIADFGGGNRQFLFVHLEVRYASPYWSVNTSSFQYNMQIIANFSTTALNAPLSADANDKIAVFVGNECRGVANIAYAQIGNIWSAYLTVHSNTVSGEQLRFRMWDASTGTEYEAVENATFVNNATLGQQLAPMILHPVGVVQRVPVAQGWNWFSLNVISSDMSVNNMLRYLKADSAMIVKTDNQYAQFGKGISRWAGSLNAFGYQKSYMIFMSHADTLQFVGNHLLDTVTVSFANGWNWAPYPQVTIQSVNTFMNTFAAANNDVLKSQTQFATYSGGGWSGSLSQLVPGQGYKLQTSAGGTVSVYPGRSMPGWSVSEFDYEYNMNVTAVLNVNGVESNGNYLIGAFINNTCIGVGNIENAGNYARIFMTLHGNTNFNNQSIEFRVYGYGADSVYAPTYLPLNYSADAQTGSIEEPFALNITVATTAVASFDASGYALYQNLPNPFNGKTVIRFVIPKTETVTITVYDYTGKQVRVIANTEFGSGEHTVEFNEAELSSGIYYYTMKAGEFIQTKKMILQH